MATYRPSNWSRYLWGESMQVSIATTKQRGTDPSSFVVRNRGLSPISNAREKKEDEPSSVVHSCHQRGVACRLVWCGGRRVRKVRDRRCGDTRQRVRQGCRQ